VGFGAHRTSEVIQFLMLLLTKMQSASLSFHPGRQGYTCILIILSWTTGMQQYLCHPTRDDKDVEMHSHNYWKFGSFEV